MSIFRAYDIRGIYGKDLTDEIAEKIAKAFINLLQAKKAVVGIDVRMSSPELKESVVKGLISQGCDVIDIGLVPIPVFYYFIVKYKMKAGVYVTGSHDPLGYNGLKLCKAKAIDLTYESGIEKLERIYDKKYPEREKGIVVKKDVSNEYKKQLREKFKRTKPLHIVIDAGNGCCSKIAPELFEELGFKVTRLFCEFNGTFPNRPPEPLEKNLKHLKDKIKEVKADLGIAYDVDGDRVVFIDEKGRFVHPDFTLMLFAIELLKKNDSLIATIVCTKSLEKLAHKFKWKLIWSRVGRSYVKQKMFKNKVVIGGEISGHYFFKENNYYDDGLFASLALTKILGKEKKPLSYLINRLPYYPSVDLRMHCKENKKIKVIEEVKKKFKNYKLILIDGIGIKFKNGFALIRPSNTEEKLELKIEANNKSELIKIKKEMEQKIKLAMK
jgi:phosphomannomutase/phosphoglucomutase